MAAFYYDPGDYTGVKDAMQVWWDPGQTVPGQNLPGCYKVTDDGNRFQSGDWRPGFNAFVGSDPCTRFFDATERKLG